jgi:hypothetical protein
MASREHPVTPHKEAYPLERRREDMKKIIEKASREGWLTFVRPEFVAITYGISAASVEAEMMKHLQEGCDK